MHWSAWEARISYLLVQNCSWNSSGDRGTQGQAESKVSQVLAGLRMVVIASSEASSRPTLYLLAVEVSDVIPSSLNYISHDH